MLLLIHTKHCWTIEFSMTGTPNRCKSHANSGAIIEILSLAQWQLQLNINIKWKIAHFPFDGHVLTLFHHPSPTDFIYRYAFFLCGCQVIRLSCYFGCWCALVCRYFQFEFLGLFFGRWIVCMYKCTNVPTYIKWVEFSEEYFSISVSSYPHANHNNIIMGCPTFRMFAFFFSYFIFFLSNNCFVEHTPRHQLPTHTKKNW